MPLSREDALKRTPRGFEASAGGPVAESLKLKSLVVSRALTLKDLRGPMLVATVAKFRRGRAAAVELRLGRHRRRRLTPHVGRASSQARADASDGIRQSPRGDRLTDPTFGPSGMHDRLNWLAKKRRRKTASHFSTSAGVYGS